jgi:hypothetical protein
VSDVCSQESPWPRSSSRSLSRTSTISRISRGAHELLGRPGTVFGLHVDILCSLADENKKFVVLSLRFLPHAYVYLVPAYEFE